jgi:hypothetical protein
MINNNKPNSTMFMNKTSFRPLCVLLILLVTGLSSAHAQKAPFEEPTAKNCKDIITTLDNREIACRVDSFNHNILYFSLPPGSLRLIKSLPLESIKSIYSGDEVTDVVIQKGHLEALLVTTTPPKKYLTSQKAPFEEPTAKNCKDIITTIDNREIACRVDSFNHNILYYSLPPDSPYIISSLPLEKIKSIYSGDDVTDEIIQKGHLEPLVVKKTPPSTQLPPQLQGTKVGKVSIYVSAILGLSKWAGTTKTDSKLNDLQDLMVLKRHLEYRVAVIGSKHIGGYIWLDNRQTSVNGDQLLLNNNARNSTASTSLSTGGAGVVYRTANEHQYAQFYAGFGYGQFSVDYKPYNQSLDAVSSIATGMVANTSLALCIEPTKSFYLGFNVGVVVGTGYYTTNNLGSTTENFTNYNVSVLAGLHF